MNKFNLIIEKGTNGIGYGVSTDKLVEQLKQWDNEYNLDILDVEKDRLTVKFGSLPASVEKVAREAYLLCPDIVDHHFGCIDGMIETLQSLGEELEPELEQLIKGVDFSDRRYGEELLQRSIATNKSVALWWD